MTKPAWVSLIVAIQTLGVVGATLASAAPPQGDPRIGTWRLDLVKSTFSPDPGPKSQTLTFDADPSGSSLVMTVLVQGVDASGNIINPDKKKGLIVLDGKDHPLREIAPYVEHANWDTSAYRRIDAYTWKVTRKRAGKFVGGDISRISKDGKTLTVTSKGLNARGEEIHNIIISAKQ